MLRNISISATKILRTAKDEQSKGSLPSDEEILNSKLGDMLPFRMQPVLMAKFQTQALDYLKLPKTEVPALRSDFKTLDEVIEFFEGLQKVYESMDEKAYNDAAEKSVEIPFESMGKTLKMTGFADYIHSFVIPNSFFHLSAMYMVLRNVGFNLGKSVYVGAFMSEQQQKDWAPLRG